MSKLPNFVFRKIQNCTGCQIFILGYHLSITFSIILGILGATLSAITSFLFTSPLPHLNLTFHILLYIYCFEFVYISSVMTDEISFMMKLYACCQNGYKSCIAAKWFSVRRYSVKSSASFLVDTFGWYLKAKILMTGFKGDWDNDTAPSWLPWKFANRYFSYACRMVMSFLGLVEE